MERNKRDRGIGGVGGETAEEMLDSSLLLLY